MNRLSNLWLKAQKVLQAASTPTTIEVHKEFEENIKNVRMQLKDAARGNVYLQEVLKQLFIENYTAPSREGDDIMNEISTMNARLSVVETEVKNITTTVNRMETALANMPTKDFIENIILKATVKYDTEIAVIKNNISEINKKADNTVTNRKWIVTTVVAALGLIATVIKIIIG